MLRTWKECGLINLVKISIDAFLGWRKRFCCSCRYLVYHNECLIYLTSCKIFHRWCLKYVWKVLLQVWRKFLCALKYRIQISPGLKKLYMNRYRLRKYFSITISLFYVLIPKSNFRNFLWLLNLQLLPRLAHSYCHRFL